MNNFGSIEFHFDGDIIKDHEIPLHVLAKSLTKIESSVNRAYLAAKHGYAEKHRRMSSDDYKNNKFWVGKAKDGGFILDLVAGTTLGRRAIDKLGNAMSTFVDNMDSKAGDENAAIQAQVLEQKRMLTANGTFTNYSQLREEGMVRREHYVTKSILKEYDELLTFISDTNKFGSNIFEITFHGTATRQITFTPERARIFKKVLKKRTVGKAVLYKGEITYLNIDTLTAKFKNVETNKKAVLRMIDEPDYLKIHPYAVPGGEISFIGVPVLEYDALDAVGGDIYFLTLAG